MIKTVDGERYIDTKEAIAILGSRGAFYNNVRGKVKKHPFDGKKKPWYKEKDIIAVRDGKAIEEGHVVISGINSNWTEFLRSLGYRPQTDLRETDVRKLPDDAIRFFHLSDEEAQADYLKTSKMTFANGQPICTWSTYYPLQLVEEIQNDIKHEKIKDVVLYIKDRHDLIVRYAIDKYGARQVTLDEHNLFRTSIDESVLLLRRPSFTDGDRLLFYSDMVLLGSWFQPEHRYEVHIWD